MTQTLDPEKTSENSEKLTQTIQIKDKFTKITLICLGASVTSILFQIINTFALFQVANQPPPTLVQLQDGNSINVQSLSSLERTDQSIETFVHQILTMIFTWNGVMPHPQDGTKLIEDQGVKVKIDDKNIGKVTTPAWIGSYGMELNFRQEFLKNLAKLVPQSVFNQEIDVVFVPVKILPPERLEQGKWKIRLISNLLFVSQKGTNQEAIVPYNVDIYLRAVTPWQNTQVEGENPPLSEKIATIRQAALEITAITPISEENLNE